MTSESTDLYYVEYDENGKTKSFVSVSVITEMWKRRCKILGMWQTLCPKNPLKYEGKIQVYPQFKDQLPPSKR